MIKDAQDFFQQDNAGWEIFYERILNNSFFLNIEHLILSLLSDDRKQKRRLGVKYIFHARENRAPGIRYFIKMDRTNLNLDANDYSEFLDIKSLTIFTEPPCTMHLTEDQLVDILNGFSSVIDLCDLQDVHCHTQVNDPKRFIFSACLLFLLASPTWLELTWSGLRWVELTWPGMIRPELP